MGNFFKHHSFNCVVAIVTAISFTFSVLTPSSAYSATGNVNAATVVLGVKMEKIFQKIKRAINNKELDKIISCTLEIKTEVEHYTGKSIDIGKEIDKIERKSRESGNKIDPSHIKQIKKNLIKKDNKNKNRTVWFAHCMQSNSVYSCIEADAHFDMMYSCEALNETENTIPFSVNVGITVALAGVFLMLIPTAPTITAGKFLLGTGFSILSGKALSTMDEKEEREKKEKK